jgi:hypothetical protein
MGGFFVRCSYGMKETRENNEYYCSSINIKDYERTSSLYIDSRMDRQ